MEANTLVLSLAEYNALRDFKTNLEKGNTYRTLEYRQCSYGSQYVQGLSFISTDEAVKEAALICEEQHKEIEVIKKENAELKQGILKEWDKKTNKIRKMSIWEFLKWRKK